MGIFAWKKYKNWRLVLVALIFGIFIDVDHWFDYFAYFGVKNLNVKNYLDVNTYMDPSQKVYVLFHGWEYMPILGFLGGFIEKKFKVRGLVLAAVFSYGAHLLWDNFAGAHHPLAYFIIYRIINNFSVPSFNGF